MKDSIHFSCENNDVFESFVSEEVIPQKILKDKRNSAKLSSSKTLSREQKNPETRIDLHGNTKDEAMQRLRNFIDFCHRKNLSRILVITGKGKNSGERGPVIKAAVSQWLEEQQGELIVKFGEASKKMGGSGAFFVFLKTKKTNFEE